MPEWANPVAHYMLHDGLTATLRIAVYAVIGSTVLGVVLGTLMTIRFLPLQALIRLYVEVWRGLPILVTIFLVYYALPTAPAIHHRFGAITGASIGLILWGSAQVAEATRAARGSCRARLRVGRPPPERDPPAGLAPSPPSARQPPCQHHSEHNDRVAHRGDRASRDRPAVDRAPSAHAPW